MVSINGKVIPWTHTICASAAFLAAFITGYNLHFHKIVTNAHYTYPDEWFPSVSATIGDRYPERSIFQILIALTALPRFLLLFGHLYLNHSLPIFILGVLRTVSCGGWVYITSTDDHDTHDIFMIIYIVLTLPWDIMITTSYPRNNNRSKRILVTSTFFGLLVPMLYCYYQHQVKHIAGAYSIYAYFEWSLIFLDIAFDSLASYEFNQFNIDINLHTSPSTTKIDVKPTKPVNKKNCIDYDSFLYLITNTFNSFILWSNITALTCSIWHFPLWYMGISGYETAIFGYLGPIFLYLPLMSIFVFYCGTFVGNLIAVGAYAIETPENRLIVCAIGTAISVANFAQNLKSIKLQTTNNAFATSWVLGLVISVVVKMGFYSNNPIWPIFNENNKGYNKESLIFVAIFGLLSPFTNSIHLNQHSIKSQQPSSKPRFISKLFISIGFGAFLFATHQLLSDSSTIIYWAWEGYNENGYGPLQWPWSSLTCLIMLLSAFLCTRFTNKPILPAIFLILSTGVLANKEIKEWPKFILGGLPYVASMISLVPTLFLGLAETQSIWVFAFAFTVYIIFILAHVWTVAYAFVPLGWLLRERIELILVASTVLILLGTFVSKKITNTVVATVKLSSKFRKITAFFTVLIFAMIAAFTYKVRPTGVPQPYHPESDLLTAGIWTIHFGLDNDMWASEDRISSLIKDMELDVVGLLESDTQHITMGNRDLTNKLAHDLNMYADFGPGPNKNTWGCALLSKFPIVNSTHYLTPSPVGEIAPVIHATLLTYNDTLVDVFVFHSGQEEDVEDRRLQSQTVAKLMGSTDRPTILLSYLVTDPLKGNYNTYVSEESGMHDIDPTDDDRWCEYILYKNIRRTGYARVARGTITDTELQVGKFQVLQDEQIEKYGSSLYTHEHVDDPEVEDLKFPDKFKGDGERGHFYHVFDKPRYYSL
ncbi:hypothetical protein KAFR_0F01430 [Kazachstania africana CBS 2517]|uniref:Calcofluor white hypersensitive protein n=1 Tax=Kazachstania africana (strain ATCC 22294 / BCRC 22015 / CBS 2517 / CECT 1963 / NBRC 1671 / NRRL Y-8276) TaxID=1071382 RepID=H2AWI9_KAZAF|nr:hypothetical protein KAFR_0F01430 [Kazachstania africana CBS 2517]CCF58739.1 hypothetical protein KAFR_0F01430 [Kazachstania africana CBS 2517]